MSEISVVIPVYNEQDSIQSVIAELILVLDKINAHFEIIIVNDGSSDQTVEIITAAGKKDSRVKLLNLDGHYGQTAAIDAGIQSAAGKKIIMLDGDGQNDPADIPELLRLSENNDVVCGWRTNRHDSNIRRLSSKIANGIRQYILGDTVPDIGCTLKVFPADKLKKIVLYEGFHRFLPVLLELEGCSIVSTPVNHRSRKAGLSKYSVGNRIFKATADMFVVKWMITRKLYYKIKS